MSNHITTSSSQLFNTFKTFFSGKVANYFFATTSTSIFIAGLNFLSGIMISRMLLPEQRGMLGNIIFFAPIISFFFISGVQESSNYYISKFQNHKSRLTKSSIILSHKLAGLALLCSIIFQSIYFRELTLLLYIATIIFSLQSFLGLASTVMLECDLGNFNFYKYNKTRILASSLYVLGVGMLFIQNIEVNVKLFFLVLLNLSLVLTSYSYRILSFINIAHKIKPSKKYEKLIFLHGVKFHFSTLLAFINKQIDKFIIMQFISLEIFGYYLVAWNLLFTLSSLVSSSLSSLAMPHLRRSKDIINKSKKYLLKSYFLILLTVCFIGILGNKSIVLLYSKKYAFSETIILYLILPVFFILSKELTYKVLKSNNLSKIPFYGELIFITCFSTLMLTIKSNELTIFIGIYSISLLACMLYILKNVLSLKKNKNAI